MQGSAMRRAGIFELWQQATRVQTDTRHIRFNAQLIYLLHYDFIEWMQWFRKKPNPIPDPIRWLGSFAPAALDGLFWFFGGVGFWLARGGFARGFGLGRRLLGGFCLDRW